MPQPVTTTDKLADASAALHRLMTGAMVVEVIIDGYSTKFAAGNIDKLREYIAQLTAENTGCVKHGAIGVVF